MPRWLVDFNEMKQKKNGWVFLVQTERSWKAAGCGKSHRKTQGLVRLSDNRTGPKSEESERGHWFPYREITVASRNLPTTEGVKWEIEVGTCYLCFGENQTCTATLYCCGYLSVCFAVLLLNFSIPKPYTGRREHRNG